MDRHQLGFNRPKAYQKLFRNYALYYKKFLEYIAHCINAPHDMLDLACGIGDFTQIMSEVFPNCSIKGVDISESYIEFAKNNYLDTNLEYYVAPAQAIQELAWVKNIDTIMIKGGYHLFESIMPLESFLEPPYNNLRQLIVIEKTQRSVITYPSPESAKAKKLSYVENDLAMSRLSTPNGMNVKSLSFGERLQIPLPDYLLAIKNRQFSYLVDTSDDEMNSWLKTIEGSQDEITLFEENVVNIYEWK